MPDIDRRPTRHESGYPLLAELLEVADGLMTIEPHLAGIESRLDGLPAEAQHIESELRRFLAILDSGRRLMAQRTAEVIAADGSAFGLPESAIDIAWTSFEDCTTHAVDHAPGRIGVPRNGYGVVLYRVGEVNPTVWPAWG